MKKLLKNKFSWISIAAVVVIAGLFSGKTSDQTTETEKTTETTVAEETKESATDKAGDSSADFAVHFIDVGQGDAALILCDGEAMLIDGGPASASSVMYSYLKKNDVKRIKYLIATHAHEDHVGGLSGALNFAKVDKAFCSVDHYDSKTFKSFLKYLDEQDVKLEIPYDEMELQVGSAIAKVFMPKMDDEDTGNDSLIVKLTYNGRSFLFTGDAETEEESLILKGGYDIDADVLKVGHHGSKTSSSKSFVKAVSPVAAVISVGADNDYGHPKQAVLDRFKSLGIDLYRTDLHGSIVFTCGEEGFRILTEKN